jgi:hypothetical protein
MKLMGSARSASWARLAPRVLLMAIALVVVIAQSGCALPLLPRPQTSFVGHVYGDALVTSPESAQATPPSPVPLRATITCNTASIIASADGAYSLSVDQTDHYSCAISAANYVPTTINIASSAGTHVRLDIGSGATTLATPTVTPTVPRTPTTPAATTICSNPIIRPAAICPPLHLKPGTISGVVTSADTQQPLAGARVTCWHPTPSAQASASLQTANTTATGAFSIAGMPAGLYGCVAAGDPTLHAGALQPAGAATVAIQACGRRCPSVTFHEGAIMHAMTAYLIFWLPHGHSFEPSGSDSRFESLMAQYFNDIGGSALYGLLTQYWDHQGSVANAVTLGGAYVDTTAYPHAGTRADPLSDFNIISEVEQDARANGWTIDGEHEFFVFTGYNVESCAPTGGGTRDCSFSNTGRHYCAYHSDFLATASSDRAIYAYMPVLSDCVQIEELSSFGSPNHDMIADATINSLSHEHFETVTDPYGRGWYDSDPSEGEIADKCEYRFGAIHAGGGNVTLGHGHSYLLQEEWSDRAGGCALQ